MADYNNEETIHNDDEEIIIKQEDNTTTGVSKNNQNTPQTTIIHMNMTEDTQDNIQTIPGEETNESDKYVTIGDINITSEMNTSNRESKDVEDEETEIRTNERYNL